MKDIVIIGAGGFGREVAWLIEDINKRNKEWNILGFVDDDDRLAGREIEGYKLVGNIDWLSKQELYVVNAIGDPLARKNIIQRIERSKNKYPVLIHPSVILSDSVVFGDGVIVCAGCIITVNVNVGSHVIINLDCTVGHDVIISDYCTILPSVNISGHVNIEEGVSVGTGSAIIQGIKVGKNTTIGAGAIVIRDLQQNCTAVGNPAKVIKSNNVG